MAFVHSGICNADELRIMKRLDVRSAAIAHTRAKTAGQLVNDLVQSSLVRHAGSDTLRNKFLDIFLVSLEITVLRTVLHCFQ